jgi:hypothetical protein
MLFLPTGHQSPLAYAEGGSKENKKKLDRWRSVIVIYISI